ARRGYGWPKLECSPVDLPLDFVYTLLTKNFRALHVLSRNIFYRLNGTKGALNQGIAWFLLKKPFNPKATTPTRWRRIAV
ncbi:hypothetical protein, partial [Pseudomonas meliae]|uniref:hypothetical protein n=1 Tax=Pseudomonas meliae TaxID=86176 RepID=UPI001F403468